MKSNNKEGFTLAEVLITLTIIGIVAALTTPSVVTNYQKRHFLVKLKDTYSILSNAKLRAEADYGPMKNWEVTRDNYFEKFVKPYLKLEKTNKTHSSHFINGVEHGYYMDPFRYPGFTKYMLPNNVEIAWDNCNNIGKSWGDYCKIFIDLNGEKNPNTFGKDIHQFTYYYRNQGKYTGKIAPYKYMNNDYQLKNACLAINDNSDSDNLGYCTSLLFKNNWQIPDDYPW